MGASARKIPFVLLLTGIIAILQSCAQPSYVPNRIPAPLLHKAHQGMLMTSISSVGGWEVQGAYSPHDHLTVIGSAFQGSRSNNGDKYEQQLWELGFGGYDTLTGYHRFGIYGGYGHGNSHTDYRMSGLFSAEEHHIVDASFHRFSLTGELGMVHPNGAEYVMALRASDVYMYHYIDITQEPHWQDTVRGPVHELFIEPAFVLRAGYPFLKFELHASLLLRAVGEKKFESANGNFSAGIVGRFDLGKFFQ